MRPAEEKNIKKYKAAFEFLKDMTPVGIDLEKYFLGDSRNYKSLRDIYVQIIHSAKNYQSMPNVIGFSKRIDKIEEILYGFDYSRIQDYSVEELYQRFRREFNVTSTDSKRNSWYKWSHSIVDAAKFMNEFVDVADFEEFVRRFDYNVSTRMALPLLISTKISGIGFALACDLLKELGFTNYPKPDTHMIDVFSGVGLSGRDAYSNFEAITRMANFCQKDDASITPYKVDKVFWLICSGRFYLETPAEVRVHGRKQELIDYLNEICEVPGV